MILSVHVSNFLDASNLDVKKKLAERGYAAALALAVQPVNAQSDETCISYMEADAIYWEKMRKLEVFCRCPPSAYEVSEASIRILKILGPPDGKPADPACPVECILKLYDLKTSRKKTYREAYDGPTSDVDSVMEKLIRIDQFVV